eukprot:1147232-Pelagomonas_calceolata.AAC.1
MVPASIWCNKQRQSPLPITGHLLLTQKRKAATDVRCSSPLTDAGQASHRLAACGELGHCAAVAHALDGGG